MADGYRKYLQEAKDMLALIGYVTKKQNKDDMGHIYWLIEMNLSRDIEYHAKALKADGVNINSLSKTYYEGIQMFKDFYGQVYKRGTKEWDNAINELYDLLKKLEVDSGLGVKYSEKR